MEETQYKGWMIEPQSYLSDGSGRWRPKAVVSSAVGGGTVRTHSISAPSAVMFHTEREANAYTIEMAKKWIDDLG
jgi:hypothetical protein